MRSAARLTQAEMGSLVQPEGSVFRQLASCGYPQELDEFMQTHPVHLGRGTITGRTLIEGKPVQVADVLADPEFTFVESVQIGGMRTMLGVPLLRDGVPIGVIVLSRRMVRPFSDAQIEVVQNFAAQAVIAIENTRLLNELRQRTSDLSQRTVDLTESLEQQTATAEVLQVISSSPGDLQPVFEAMLEKAVSICDAKFGNIFRWGGDALQLVAAHNTPPALAEARRSPFRPDPKMPIGRMLSTKTAIHVVDLAAEQVYIEKRVPGTVLAVEVGGIRTYLAVPMLKENELIGALSLSRQEVRPFTDKQIELIKNFAAQAAIAIENARLLSELRESLQRQTATSDVLQVISSSPGEVLPVFEAIIVNAVGICAAKSATLWLYDDGGFQPVARYKDDTGRALAKMYPSPKTGLGRLAATKQMVHIHDYSAEPAYTERDPFAVTAVETIGVRTNLNVPMLKEGKLVGAISIYRTEVRPFTQKQIELIANFAAQAVIAIENARLLKELRARTGQVEALNKQLEQRVADQVGEIERMSRLRRFLPPQVADLIVASGTEKQLESHRREITALFCDLRGFTGFSESSDPEDVMTLLRDYHAAIGEIIVKYNGTLERYAGDGVMVVFNDPIPVDNPALQAVLMALEMREAIGALTERWRQLGHEIGFGIGIAHGYATLGTIGFEGRFDYAAIGTVSNVASRLCDEAKPGQILISPRVLMAVKDAITVEAVGEFELKGIRRPIAAYNVLAALPPSP